MTERNVYVDGTWYGPDYPDAGQPPADKVDGEFLSRKTGEIDDGDWVGVKAVTEPEEAWQFGSPAPAAAADDGREDDPDVEPVGMKAVTTQEEAAAFRGRSPGRRAAPPAESKVDRREGSGGSPATDAPAGPGSSAAKGDPARGRRARGRGE